eukprot:g11391.t1
MEQTPFYFPSRHQINDVSLDETSSLDPAKICSVLYKVAHQSSQQTDLLKNLHIMTVEVEVNDTLHQASSLLSNRISASDTTSLATWLLKRLPRRRKSIPPSIPYFSKTAERRRKLRKESIPLSIPDFNTDHENLLASLGLKVQHNDVHQVHDHEDHACLSECNKNKGLHRSAALNTEEFARETSSLREVCRQPFPPPRSIPSPPASSRSGLQAKVKDTKDSFTEQPTDTAPQQPEADPVSENFVEIVPYAPTLTMPKRPRRVIHIVLESLLDPDAPLDTILEETAEDLN